MNKNINIINSKENILDLEISIEGIKSDKKQCFFVIETKEVDFSFKCENTSGDKWTVKIPPLPQIEDTLYNFYTYMVIDGYYFEPYNGTINIVKSAEVYVKDISNKTFKPTTATTKPVEEKVKPLQIKKETIIPKKSSISDLAKRILSAPQLKEEHAKNDKKIKDILKEAKIISKNVKLKASTKIHKGEVTEF